MGVPVDDAWAVLTDVERIAPCMPGAELQEVEGDEYRGVVKVKVGPITAQYKGAARFVEKDDSAHRAVLRAEGRDTRGQGNANATITASLTPDGDGTHVSVVTDLTVTGKVAQFGRGVLVDVSGRLLDQFVACLESDVLVGRGPGRDSSGGAPAAMPAPEASQAPAAVAPASALAEPEPSAAPDASPPMATATASNPTSTSTNGSSSDGIRKITSKAAEPVDLLGAAGAPVAKRALPLVAALVLLVLLLRRRRPRR